MFTERGRERGEKGAKIQTRRQLGEKREKEEESIGGEEEEEDIGG